MASALPSVLLSLLFLIPFLAATIAINNNHLQSSSNSNFPKLEAKKLIRDLNLFPDINVNVATHEPKITPKKIVEKRFKFPFLGSSSIQELGHHAGYYQLSHSHAARYI